MLKVGKISGGYTLGKGMQSFTSYFASIFNLILGMKFESLFLLGNTYYFLRI